MRPPAFWDTQAGRSSGAVTRALLSPLGAIYAAATAHRIATTQPAPAPVPVICVGNLTVGGTGKTPVVQTLLTMAAEAGRQPAALSRGHGGALKGPVQVDPTHHTPADVGDEPVLLAQSAPVYIDRNRVEGAKLAARDGAGLIIMDDGHQNPKLEKTLSIVVVDGVTGWGAGKVLPAGPLREPVKAGLARADAVIVMVPDPSSPIEYQRLALDTLEIPVLKAWLGPTEAPPAGPLLAFAGIGRPQKFFDSVKAAGAELADAVSFPDHHPYTPRDLDHLRDLADDHDAQLITTQKDWVRLPTDMQAQVTAWPVRAQFEEPARALALIEEAVDRFSKRG